MKHFPFGRRGQLNQAERCLPPTPTAKRTNHPNPFAWPPTSILSPESEAGVGPALGSQARQERKMLRVRRPLPWDEVWEDGEEGW